MKYPTTPKSLIDKLRDGDSVSWEEFVAKYREIIISVGRLKGLTEHECDDLIQEVMLRFFQNSKTFVFDPDIARFRTYFGRIVHGKIIDIIRRRPPVTVGIGKIRDDYTESDSEPDELLNAVLLCEWRKLLIRESLAALKNQVQPLTFCAFEMMVLQRRPVEEVAKLLNITRNQIYLAKKRCMPKLKGIMADINANDPAMELSENEI